MILNIENYTIKIDHEARTVEVSQKTLNVETETLMEAVERVSQPTLEDYEEMSQHFETGPQFHPANHPDHTTRKPRALETQPRAPCRSTCCGTLNRRTRDGSCAGCRDLTPVERATLFLTNNDILEMVE